MQALTLLFVVLVVIRLTLELLLARRQIRYVHAHRDQVPAPFAGQVLAADHARAADYTVVKARFGMLLECLDTVLLMGWTVAGGIGLLQHATRSVVSSPVWAGALLLVSFAMINGLLQLPSSLYATFGIEARFGFNRTTARIYVLDRIKTVALLLGLGLPLALVVLWLMEKMGPAWWLYVWGVWTGFGLLMTILYPSLIAPLFNKFRPLGDQALKERIEKLLNKVGFRSRSVQVMDSSKRSSHGNAYFTGLGRAKRIVFFDTLLERLDETEVEAVLAHELGHFKLHHVRDGFVVGAAMSLLGLAVLGYLAGQDWFYLCLGVAEPSMAAALLLFMMASPAVIFPLTPLSAWWSRRHEYQADRFAAQHSEAHALASALVKLHRDNASTLTPDPLHSAVYDSHPTVLQRIAAMS